MNSLSLSELGNRIREEREKQKLTQEQLAERADIGRRTIQSIELGEKSPSLDTVWRIAVALSVPFEGLFRGATSSPDGIEEVVQRLMSFPAEDHDRIIRLFNGILDSYN